MPAAGQRSQTPHGHGIGVVATRPDNQRFTVGCGVGDGNRTGADIEAKGSHASRPHIAEKDYERLPASAEAMVYLAMMPLMTKRLAKQPALPDAGLTGKAQVPAIYFDILVWDMRHQAADVRHTK